MQFCLRYYVNCGKPTRQVYFPSNEVDDISPTVSKLALPTSMVQVVNAAVSCIPAKNTLITDTIRTKEAQQPCR